MRIDNFGNSFVIVSLANGAVVYYHRKVPLAAYIPGKGFFKSWHMINGDFQLTHKYVAKWRSSECQIISDSTELERMVSEL